MNDLVKREKLVADILRKLAERGLRQSSLTPEESGCIEHDDRELCTDCFIWLKREGILHNSNGSWEGVDGVTLTALGFSLLQSTSAPIER